MWRSLVTGAMYTPKIKTDSLLMYLDFGNPRCYPKSGTVVRDLASRKYVGATIGSPAFDSSNNGSLVFDGTNAKRVEITLPSTATSNVTLQGWVYLYMNKKGAAFKTGNGTGGFAIGQGFGNFDTVGNQLVALYASVRWISIGYILPAEGWYFLTMALDGSGVPYVYVNNTFVNSFSGTAPSAPTTYMELGTNQGDNESTRRLTGKISTFAYYSRQLALSDVIWNYNATRGRYGR